MARLKSSVPDEWKPKPSKMRIAAMRILWGDTPVVPARPRKGGEVPADPVVFIVPSESTGEKYIVNLSRQTCSCPGWRKNRRWDKHLEAARIFKASIQLDADQGREPGALMAVPNPYKQEPWYDALTSREEHIVRELARCLGAHFDNEPKKGKPGPKGYPLGDFLACGIVAGYLNRPSRKAIPFHAAESNLIRGEEAPYHSTLRAAMKRPEMLKAVIESRRMVAMCTSRIDTVFSLDGTVMKTPNSKVHIQRHLKGIRALTKIVNCKVHLAIGVETFMTYGVHVVDGDENDQLGFEPTMDQFVDFVRMDVLLADSGYDAADHFEYVGKRGGRAYINFGEKVRHPQAGKEHHNRQLALYKEQGEEWTEIYPYRWLSESANSSYKRTIKRVIRARFEETREVEVGLAVLAFALKWLAHARAKFGPDRVPIPWADAEAVRLIDEVVEKCRGRRRKGSAAEQAA